MTKIKAHFYSSNIELEVEFLQSKKIVSAFHEGKSPIIITNNKTHVDVSKAYAIEVLTEEEN
ncbi:hypothetical protein [Bacillus wiedmannii]|uniref:hypothetical protein n=1 Tax=Bacillus wiedmannii TaxID=1890302 RepID=UPI000BF1EE7D|nr:hypothetical protein [Bacillus wiedmannii]PEM30146.1 hypothetical protein CN598_12505 [Bacillus wiedmannii]